MNIPSQTSLCGRILLLLSDGVPRTREEIHKALHFPDGDRETTARIRDLRHVTGVNLPPAECRRHAMGGRSYYYRIASLSPRVRAEVNRWRQGRKAA
ncbi:MULTISPECIES: hypothetical protein [unclassified Marinobacter]|uniref:hypothetical protein n=1 Tax=unclassified Marinobacter TaxID=83889 RepID=UPI001927888E|nr:MULTISPECIES: hypothetical protein [unclassified Marinobacter]MBL3825135.1 hypothetical protein [Marinobacter sp. MC3]MBL3893661.1 hypothetical protein [Marinobacter sp. MW3]